MSFLVVILCAVLKLESDIVVLVCGQSGVCCGD